MVFTARPVGGQPTPSRESRAVHWVAADQLDSLTMHPSMRLRINHYLTGNGEPTSADGRRPGAPGRPVSSRGPENVATSWRAS